MGAEDGQRFAIGHVVAGKVGSRVLLGEFSLAAMQLLLHGGEENIVGGGLGAERFLAKQGNQKQRKKNAEEDGFYRIHRDTRVYRSGSNKKSGPFRGQPFKEARWRESEDKLVTPFRRLERTE